MTPRDKVKAGYLTWTENFEIQQAFTIVNPYKRFIIGIWNRLKYYYRYSTNKPVTWESKLKEYKRVRQDLSQIDTTKFYKLQKKLNS